MADLSIAIAGIRSRLEKAAAELQAANSILKQSEEDVERARQQIDRITKEQASFAAALAHLEAQTNG